MISDSVPAAIAVRVKLTLDASPRLDFRTDGPGSARCKTSPGMLAPGVDDIVRPQTVGADQNMDDRRAARVQCPLKRRGKRRRGFHPFAVRAEADGDSGEVGIAQAGA